MTILTDHPLLLFVVCVPALWFSAWIGASIVGAPKFSDADANKNFDVIEGAALTLLALIIAFTFSMAVSRYDQRKNLEEAEANAIGTELIRADFLPGADAAKVRALLRDYLDQRILFYAANDGDALAAINARTAKLQSDLWSAVKGPATAQPTPVAALVVSGMNDVLNSQGYTQAAWWNRIPVAAWALMGVIAVGCNLLIGFGARSVKTNHGLLAVLPLLAAIAFFLIADIDSPRGGVIRVKPQNLLSLSQSLRAP